MNDEGSLQRPKALNRLASLAAISLFVVDCFVERGDRSKIYILGLIFLGAAVVFAFPPFLLLSKYGKVEEGKSYMHTTTIVDRNLYAVVRHPQYLGYILLVLGFVLISQNWIILLLGGLSVTLFYLHSLREENFCARQFGEAYTEYMKRVPRFNFLSGIIRLLRRRSGSGD